MKKHGITRHSLNKPITDIRTLVTPNSPRQVRSDCAKLQRKKTYQEDVTQLMAKVVEIEKNKCLSRRGI